MKEAASRIVAEGFLKGFFGTMVDAASIRQAQAIVDKLNKIEAKQ